MTEESLSVKTSASYPNLLNLEDSSGSLIGGQSGMDDGTHLSVGETVVIGEVQKKKPTKKGKQNSTHALLEQFVSKADVAGKKQSVVDTHTTIHSGRPASNSNVCNLQKIL